MGPTRHRICLIEPFAGGGIVSLTAVMERLVNSCLMVELDPDVTALLESSFISKRRTHAKIRQFDPTRSNIEQLTRQIPRTILERGFALTRS